MTLSTQWISESSAGIVSMTWTTIEHWLNHDQAVERVAERRQQFASYVGFGLMTRHDEWNGVS